MYLMDEKWGVVELAEFPHLVALSGVKSDAEVEEEEPGKVTGLSVVGGCKEDMPQISSVPLLAL